jgi:AP2-like factor, euAP2 lineage
MKQIKLNQNNFVLVDDEDFDLVSKYHCYFDGLYVRVRTGKNPNYHFLKLSRILMKAKIGEVVDHIDHNTLNEQKKNLRICSTSLNGANRKLNKNNTSGYKGVSWNESGKGWVSQTMKEGKWIYFGLFKDKKDAAIAYNNGAKKYFGEFAKLNKII